MNFSKTIPFLCIAGLIVGSALTRAENATQSSAAGDGKQTAALATSELRISGLTHIGIRSLDMDRSVAFWRDIIGWEVIGDTYIEPPALDTIWGKGVRTHNVAIRSKDGGALVELVQFLSPPPAKVRPTQDLGPMGDRGPILAGAFRVPDLNAAYNQMKAKGVKFLSTPNTLLIKKTNHTVRQIFFVDPDGTMLELVEGPVPESH